MSRAGRVRPYIAYASFCACVAIVTTRDYGVPIEIKLWDTGRTPLAHMVDVTNGFGLKVLAEHNFLNDNNIAFSPYGLMGIMVALYEGVDGESSYQIQRGMQLPWNRNVMRIGFRDIHRTLKTYFVPEEGFLAGLALNNENVTFNDSYKKILRFYGFDLENEQIPTLPPSNGTANATEATTVAAPIGTTTSMASPTGAENMGETSTATTKEETTLNPNAETVDIGSTSEASTASQSLAPNAEETTATPPSATPTTTVTEMTTSIPTVTTESTATDTTTNQPSTREDTTSTTTTMMMQSMETDAETISQQTSQATSALPDDPTTNEVSSSILEMESATSETTTLEPSTMSMSETTGTDSTSVTTEVVSTDLSTETPATTTEALETLQRRKKSIVDFIFTNPPYVDDYFFYRSYHVGPEMPTPPLDDKMFLANGLKSIQVTYMNYETVLEHAYLPHLEASALRLPLDSERYYLLVVLPDRRGVEEIGRLLGRMARESDLADVYSALRPRRVRAVVPSFTVKGHVTLTTDLQKLGIRDVFEPRQRDFTPMTRQPGVYVRSIEQAVSVAIRKYKPDDPKKNRYVVNRDPVKFYATYPFLYFVMDASIHVALMAGKMVDPLNSRIL